MLSLIVAAAVTVGLGERPPAFLGPEGADAYSTWLAERAIEVEASYSHQPCLEATTLSLYMQPIDEELARDRVQMPPHEGPVIRESVRVAGCGRTSLQNIVVIHQADGGWAAQRMMPGASAAGFVLQRKALLSAAQAALVGPPPLACEQSEFQSSFRIADITLASFTDTAHAWSERWPLAACGADRPVVVTFTPRNDGGVDIGAKPDW